MKVFRSTLSDLLPLIASTTSFNAPENAITIQSKISKLSDIRKLLYHDVPVSSSDPTIAYIATAFDQNLTVVNDSLKAGRRDYARYLLLNTTSYCIECHTQTSGGSQFFGSMDSSLVGTLNPIEKTEYLVATRKYQEALETIEQTILKGIPREMALSSDRLVRYAFVVSVRYYRDPELTQKFVGLVKRSQDLPMFLNRDIQGWQETLKDWSARRVPETKDTKKYLAFTEDLIKKGNAINNKNSSQHAGDIYFLRAYSMLSELLKTNPHKAISAKILMLMGDSYLDATDSLFWTLPRYYYEACIRTDPHTVQSVKCYQRFEEATSVAYSAGGGITPLSVLVHLKELQDLSIRR